LSATGPRVDRELSAQILGSLAHVVQTHSFTPQAWIEAASIVDDPQAHASALVLTAEFDRDFAGGRVPFDVGQRLLGDAKEGHALTLADDRVSNPIQQRDL